jgi:hypothetical protein
MLDFIHGAKGNRGGVREKIHPRESLVLSALVDFVLFLADGRRHDEELIARLGSFDTTNAFPDLVCVEGLAFVDEEAGTLWEEEHSNEFISIGHLCFVVGRLTRRT